MSAKSSRTLNAPPPPPPPLSKEAQNTRLLVLTQNYLRRVSTCHTVLKRIPPRPRPQRPRSAIHFFSISCLAKNAAIAQYLGINRGHFPAWTRIPSTFLSPVNRCAARTRRGLDRRRRRYSAGFSSSRRCCTPAIVLIFRLTLLLASSKPGSKSEALSLSPPRIVFQVYRDIQSVDRYTSRDALGVPTPPDTLPSLVACDAALTSLSCFFITSHSTPILSLNDFFQHY